MTYPSEPTEAHEYWQDFVEGPASPPDELFFDAFPASLRRNVQLMLPIRALPDGQHGLASLIINQASFGVVSALADVVAEQLAPFAPELVVGLPTLGLTLASAVAQRLGHSRYVPLGTSRKFWYDESLSVALSSITTPEQSKRLYVDPRMRPLIEGRRIALIDDVISSGRSIVSGLQLLSALGTPPVVVGAAMLQTDRWREPVSAQWPGPVVGALSTPLLQHEGACWRAVQ